MRKNEHSIGVIVSEITSDSSTATVQLMPNWKKNRPMAPCMNATGTKMATIDSVAAMAAKLISRAPKSDAL